MGAICSSPDEIQVEDDGCCFCCASSSSPADTMPKEFDLIEDYPFQSDEGVDQRRKGGKGHVKTASSLNNASSVFDLLYGRYLPFVVRERFLSAALAAQSQSTAPGQLSPDVSNDPSSLPPALSSSSVLASENVALARSVQPRCELECFEAAMSFVDISGFTRLSEELVNLHGTNGAEVLNEIISGYFQKLIDLIVDFGGDIIKFAGDAMLVMWRNKGHQKNITIPSSKPERKASDPTSSTSPSPSSPSSSPDTADEPSVSGKSKSKKKDAMAFMGGADGEPLFALLLRAIACNLTLLRLHNNFQPTPSNTLQLHTGLACGIVSGIYVGGHEGVWEYFVAGQPIQNMAVACDAAKSGEVVLHAGSVDLVKHFVKLKRCPGTAQAFVITQLLDAPRMFKSIPTPIPSLPYLTEALESFVPRLVKGRMERDWVGPDGTPVTPIAGAQSSLWLAEFRQRVCVMFVALPSLCYQETAAANEATLAVLQEMVLAVQESVARWEGTVARLLSDDKGTRFKIAFGMPTLAHEDDPVRALSAALDIEQRVRTIVATHPLSPKALKTTADGVAQTQLSIGIASGTVYCGEAGSAVRCEYTAVGFIVILAARLMSKACAAGGGIYSDRETMRQAQSTGDNALSFESLPPVILKGVSKPVPVFRPYTTQHMSVKGAKLLGIQNESLRSGGKSKQQALQALQQHIKVPAFLNAQEAKMKEVVLAAMSQADLANASGSNNVNGVNVADAKTTAKSNDTRPAYRRSITYARSIGAAASGSTNPTSSSAEATSSSSSDADPYPDVSSAPISSLIGRTKEKRFLLSLLDRISVGDESHVVLIEAEAGLGKSALIYDVLQSVEKRGVEFFFGYGDLLEKRTPYFAWRSIFEQLFPGLETLTHPSQRRKHLEGVLSDELLGWGVLLNNIMGTNFAETEFTLQMTTESRAKNLQRLLVAILGETAKEVSSAGASAANPNGFPVTTRKRGISSVTKSENSLSHQQHQAMQQEHSYSASANSALDNKDPTEPMSTSSSSSSSSAAPQNPNAPFQLQPRVIVLEDLHFFDSGSWELLVDVCKLLPNLLLLLTTRPLLTKIIHLSKLTRMRGEVESLPPPVPVPQPGQSAEAKDAAVAAAQAAQAVVGESQSIEACFHKIELHELDRNESLSMAWIKFGGQIPLAERAAAAAASISPEEREKERQREAGGSAAKPKESIEVIRAAAGSLLRSGRSNSNNTNKAPGSPLPPSVQIPASLQSLLYETSRGNPLYLEELCRSLLEEGVVTPIPALKTTAFSIVYNAQVHDSQDKDKKRHGSTSQSPNSSSVSASGNSSGQPGSSASVANSSFSTTGSSLFAITAPSFAKNVLQLMMARVDRLPPSQQITLKVCSVIGLEIRVEVVMRIHPMQTSAMKGTSSNVAAAIAHAQELLKRDLDALVDAGILLLSESVAIDPQVNPDSLTAAQLATQQQQAQNLYSFKNAMFREAAYSMLSLQQRITLHEQCALYYEQTYSRQSPSSPSLATSSLAQQPNGISDTGDAVVPSPGPALFPSPSASDRAEHNELEPYYSLLNHHWLKAEKWGRALHYTMASGRLALSVNANHEAIKMFELAAEILKKPGCSSAVAATQHEQELLLLSIHSNLAHALYALGRYSKSIQHIETSLALLDIPLHATSSSADRDTLVANSLGKTDSRANSPTSPTLTAAAAQANNALSLHQQALGADDRDAKSIDLKKLLKTLVKSWGKTGSSSTSSTASSKDTLSKEAREKITNSIRLLEKLCRSSVLSGLMWRAAHAAYLMLTLAERTGDAALLALSYSQCAVSLHEAGEGWGELGDAFKARTRAILADMEANRAQKNNAGLLGSMGTTSNQLNTSFNQAPLLTDTSVVGGQSKLSSTMSPSTLAQNSIQPASSPKEGGASAGGATVLSLIRPLDHARLKFQDSLLSAYAGLWNQALSSLVTARTSFARLSENKYWREATFVQGLVFYFMARWNESFTAFAGLAESACMDGDRHFEVAGEYWKLLLGFTVDGVAVDAESVEQVAQQLEALESITEEELQQDDAAAAGGSGSAITAHTLPVRLLSLYHAYNVNNDPNPFMNALPFILKVIGEPPNLLQNFPLFLHALSLISEILEKSDEEERAAAEEKKLAKKAGNSGISSGLASKGVSSQQVISVPMVPRNSHSASIMAHGSIIVSHAAMLLGNGTPVPTLLSSAQTKKLLNCFEKLLDKFRSFSASFPPALPWYSLYKGRFHWLHGRRTKACKKWKQAVDLARKDGQSFVVASAYYLLGSRPLVDANLSAKDRLLSRSLLLRSAALLRKQGILFQFQSPFKHIHAFAEKGEVGDGAEKILGRSEIRDELVRQVLTEKARAPPISLSQRGEDIGSGGSSSALKNPYNRAERSTTATAGPFGSRGRGAQNVGDTHEQEESSFISRYSSRSRIPALERRGSLSALSALPAAFRRTNSNPAMMGGKSARGSLILSPNGPSSMSPLANPPELEGRSELEGLDGIDGEVARAEEGGEDSEAPAPIAPGRYLRRASMAPRPSLQLLHESSNSSDKKGNGMMLSRRASEGSASLLQRKLSAKGGLEGLLRMHSREEALKASVVEEEGEEEAKDEEEEEDQVVDPSIESFDGAETTRRSRGPSGPHVRPSHLHRGSIDVKIPPTAFMPHVEAAEKELAPVDERQVELTPLANPSAEASDAPNSLLAPSAPPTHSPAASLSINVRYREGTCSSSGTPSASPGPNPADEIDEEVSEPSSTAGTADEANALQQKEQVDKEEERQVPLPRFARRTKARTSVLSSLHARHASAQLNEKLLSPPVPTSAPLLQTTNYTSTSAPVSPVSPLDSTGASVSTPDNNTSAFSSQTATPSDTPVPNAQTNTTPPKQSRGTTDQSSQPAAAPTNGVVAAAASSSSSSASSSSSSSSATPPKSSLGSVTIRKNGTPFKSMHYKIIH